MAPDPAPPSSEKAYNIQIRYNLPTMPDQRSLHALLEAGLEAHRRGNLDMAKNAFERTLSVAPNNA